MNVKVHRVHIQTARNGFFFPKSADYLHLYTYITRLPALVRKKIDKFKPDCTAPLIVTKGIFKFLEFAEL